MDSAAPGLDGSLPVHDLAAREDAAELRFSLRDGADAPVPGRLTFLPRSGDGDALLSRADLFPVVDAAPGELAVRRNVIYTRRGEGVITVPPGRYVVRASRGPEWSAPAVEVDLPAGGRASADLVLERELDTTGWIAADLQVHTRTWSGHGDADLNERLLSLVGEGVEFVVASDHDHLSSYAAGIEALDLGAELAWVTGVEVTTPGIGHFNLFPLAGQGVGPDPDADDPRTLFARLRTLEGPDGIRPLLQLNHPRGDATDYFGADRLDPVTGAPGWDRWSDDFDLVEILNRNEARGWFDLDLHGPDTETFGLHWVLADWFHLLNRGRRATATGSSDSHHVEEILPGYPRTWIASTSDAPASLDPSDLAEALRAGRCFVSTGPFLGLQVEGVGMGGTARAQEGWARVDFRVQAASWIDCDRVKIIVNGDVARVVDLPATRKPLRVDGSLNLHLDADAWICLVAEGDAPLAPVVHDGDRPVWPVAVTNPVWVDVDGDGTFTSVHERMEEVVARGTFSPRSLHRAPGSSEAVHLLLAAAAAGHPAAPALVRAALADPRREVRLAACRAAEMVDEPALHPLLREAFQATLADGRPDPWLAVCQLRALHRLGGVSPEVEVQDFVRHYRIPFVRKYAATLLELLPDRSIAAWTVLGPLPCDQPRCVTEVEYGPEDDPDPGRNWTLHDGQVLAWEEASTGADGFLALGRDAADGGELPALYFAQAWLHSPTEREVICALDFSDRIRLFCNGEVVLDDTRATRTGPVAHVWKLKLHEGWNRLLVKLEGQSGQGRVMVRLLEDGVTVAARR